MPFRSNFAPQTVAPVLQERNPTNIVSMVSSNQSIHLCDALEAGHLLKRLLDDVKFRRPDCDCLQSWICAFPHLHNCITIFELHLNYGCIHVHTETSIGNVLETVNHHRICHKRDVAKMHREPSPII